MDLDMAPQKTPLFHPAGRASLTIMGDGVVEGEDWAAVCGPTASIPFLCFQNADIVSCPPTFNMMHYVRTVVRVASWRSDERSDLGLARLATMFTAHMIHQSLAPYSAILFLVLLTSHFENLVDGSTLFSVIFKDAPQAQEAAHT